MKPITCAVIGLATVLSAGICNAQVDYGDIKAGSMLDGKGIRIGAFIKPLPLPPGDWLVMARNDSRRPLTGGDGSTDSTSQVTLTLKSADKENPIYFLIVSFAPDAIPVNWNGTYCETANMAFSSTYGTDNYGSASACASGQYFATGLRQYLDNAPAHANKFIQAQYGALAPYAAQAPEPYASIHINARRDRGRNLDYWVYAQIPENFRVGSGFDGITRAWAKSSAKSLMDALDNKTTRLLDFPSSEAFNLQKPLTVTDSTGNLAVELGALQIGTEVSESVHIPTFSIPLALPSGHWIVAGRRDDWVGTHQFNVTLTLRNSDAAEQLSVIVLAIHHTTLPSMLNCSSPFKSKFDFVELLKTNAASEASVCAVGKLYSTSLKQKVLYAPTAPELWTSDNLSSLLPYLNDLPDDHFRLSLTAQGGPVSVEFLLYSRIPEDAKPADLLDLPLRWWTRAVERSMTSFYKNKFRAIGPYPVLSFNPK